MAKKKKKSKAPAHPAKAQLATATNDITIPFFTDVLSPLDDTLAERGGGDGLKIYEEIERDTHAYSVLQKRKHQLIAREWEVLPGGDTSDDIAAADFVREVIADLPFDQICLDLLDATLKGFAISEVDYASDGRHLRIEKFRSLDQRRFVFDLNWHPRLLTMASPMKGEKLPDRKFQIHRFGVRGNNPYGLGLGTRLFWPVLFKRNGIGYWMKFLERFASPIPIGKYPEGISPAKQRALMVAIQGMNHASAITVPLGTDVDTFEAKRGGTVDYSAWAKFWNSEISKATLGETLTTEMGDTGARAASETHASVLDMLVDSDADLLSGSLNSGVIRWLTLFNYPNAAVPKIWRPRPSNELEQELLRQKRAERRKADMQALADARRLGFEPENVEQYMESVFGGAVRSVEPSETDGLQAQKKTPLK